METLDIIIYAAIAVFLATRLWSVLGKREDGEANAPPRPNPFGPPDAGGDDNDGVIIEGKARLASPPVSALTPEGHAPASLAGALDQMKQADKLFDEKKFLEGAKTAFKSIVAAFAAGDLTPVAWLLGPAVRQPFEAAIAARKASGQTLENKIERIAAADIVAAKTEGTTSSLSVEFVTHQVNILREATGQILDGAPNKAEEVRDLWVFRRDLTSPDPNWQLVETRS